MDRDNKLIMEALNSKFTKPVDVSDSIKTQLGQAYDIVKGLIETLDKTPSGHTPYNEMAITHLVNLQEDLKTLSQIMQDRMLNKSENAEAASAGKKRLKYDYEWVTAFLPRDLDISNRAGQEKVLDLAFKETLRLLVPNRKNPRLAARNMFGDEDFPQEIVSQYAWYQEHGFPDASADGWYAAKDEDAEGLSDQEYHKARKFSFELPGEEVGNGPIKVQLNKDTRLDCYKSGTVQEVRFSKGTIFNCDENVGDYYECDTEEYGGIAVFPDDVTVLSGEENAESDNKRNLNNK